MKIKNQQLENNNFHIKEYETGNTKINLNKLDKKIHVSKYASLTNRMIALIVVLILIVTIYLCYEYIFSKPKVYKGSFVKIATINTKLNNF